MTKSYKTTNVNSLINKAFFMQLSSLKLIILFVYFPSFMLGYFSLLVTWWSLLAFSKQDVWRGYEKIYLPMAPWLSVTSHQSIQQFALWVSIGRLPSFVSCVSCRFHYFEMIGIIFIYYYSLIFFLISFLSLFTCFFFNLWLLCLF